MGRNSANLSLPKVTIIATICFESHSVQLQALIDSGAELMGSNLAKQLGIALLLSSNSAWLATPTHCTQPISRLYILDSSNSCLILGYPWVQ